MRWLLRNCLSFALGILTGLFITAYALYQVMG